MKKSTSRDSVSASEPKVTSTTLQPLTVRRTAASTQQTKRRCIESMPIEVYYPARIVRVLKAFREGEAVFIATRWLQGQEGEVEGCEQESLDAYAIRDEFFNVKTERQALDFLRATGEFLPYRDEISWHTFRLWQRLAELVRERDTLAVAHRETMLARRPHPKAELDQVLRLLTGIYSHEYFGPPHVVPESTLEMLRRSAQVLGKKPERALVGLREGEELGRQRQRALESWFDAPPPEAYSIEFVPRERDPERLSQLGGGGALMGLLFSPEELRPILVIRPRCTLEAIAAAIYAERIASVRAGKCKGCGEWFEIGSQKGKAYCDDPRCKEKIKKRNQRNNARERAASAELAPPAPVSTKGTIRISRKATKLPHLKSA
jgi:hypothetical protein